MNGRRYTAAERQLLSSTRAATAMIEAGEHDAAAELLAVSATIYDQHHDDE